MVLHPLVNGPFSVLPVVYRLWASLRLGHLREWVGGGCLDRCSVSGMVYLRSGGLVLYCVGY